MRMLCCDLDYNYWWKFVVLEEDGEEKYTEEEDIEEEDTEEEELDSGESEDEESPYYMEYSEARRNGDFLVFLEVWWRDDKVMGEW